MAVEVGAGAAMLEEVGEFVGFAEVEEVEEAEEDAGVLRDMVVPLYPFMSETRIGRSWTLADRT